MSVGIGLLADHVLGEPPDHLHPVAAFGTTMRDETNLDALTAAMLRVVDETVQPEFVGLWLREPESHRERTNAGKRRR